MRRLSLPRWIIMAEGMVQIEVEGEVLITVAEVLLVVG